MKSTQDILLEYLELVFNKLDESKTGMPVKNFKRSWLMLIMGQISELLIMAGGVEKQKEILGPMVDKLIERDWK